jgi:hypothetical protein
MQDLPVCPTKKYYFSTGWGCVTSISPPPAAKYNNVWSPVFLIFFEKIKKTGDQTKYFFA